MVLPMAEMVAGCTRSCELIRQAGLQLIQLLMEEEVKHLVGERSQSLPDERQPVGSERATAW